MVDATSDGGPDIAAGPRGAAYGPYVEQFAWADVVLDGRVVARIELNSLSKKVRATADAVVLDGVAEFEYFPGPQFVAGATTRNGASRNCAAAFLISGGQTTTP